MEKNPLILFVFLLGIGVFFENIFLNSNEPNSIIFSVLIGTMLLTSIVIFYFHKKHNLNFIKPRHNLRKANKFIDFCYKFWGILAWIVLLTYSFFVNNYYYTYLYIYISLIIIKLVFTRKTFNDFNLLDDFLPLFIIFMGYVNKDMISFFLGTIFIFTDAYSFINKKKEIFFKAKTVAIGFICMIICLVFCWFERGMIISTTYYQIIAMGLFSLQILLPYYLPNIKISR